jgi:tetratricopeptide (TPR) repeat protein
MISPIEVNGYWQHFDTASVIEACTREIKSDNPPPMGQPYPDPRDYYSRGFARCFNDDKDKKYAEAISDLSRAIGLLRKPNPAPAQNPPPVPNPPYHPVPDVAAEKDCYAMRAYAHYLSGNCQSAIDDCVMVTKNATNRKNLAFAHELLGTIYGNQKRYHEAVEHLRIALGFSFASPGLLDNYREACKKCNS